MDTTGPSRSHEGPPAAKGSPFVSDLLWLLTASEPRVNPPHSVRLGLAPAALRDLEAVGEVAWNGSGHATALQVRTDCRCEDSTLRGWHHQLIAVAGGAPLLARFAVNPLAESAWRDTAERLVAGGSVAAEPPETRWSHVRYSVIGQSAAGPLRGRLESALRHGTTDELQHGVVVVAWTAGCFDDLSHPHGWAADSGLDEAARFETRKDLLASRLTAALAFGNEIPRP